MLNLLHVVTFALCIYNIKSQFVADDEIILPEVVKPCYRDDLNIDTCIKENMQYVITNFPGGIPELELKPLDPHVEREMKIEFRQNQISGKAVLRNITSYGLSKTKVHAVRSNIQDDIFEMEMDMSNKMIFVEGHTKGEGRINAVVVRSKGKFNNTLHDVTWTSKLTGKPEIRNGKVYMKIVKFYMSPDVGDMEVNIPPVSNNPDLNRLAHTFANTYWRLIYRELLPIVQKTWDKIGTASANKIFLKIPYSKLFPFSPEK